MKRIKFISLGLMSLTLIGVSSPLISCGPEQVKVTKIALSSTTTVLGVNNTLTITAAVSPSNASNKTLKWTSSDNSVATVNDGIVTGISAGSVKITATSTDGSNISDTMSLTIKVVKVTSISITGEEQIELNDSRQYSVSVLPSSASNKDVVWSVSDENYATISEKGLLTAKKTGSIKVIATAKDGSGITAQKDVDIYSESSPIIKITGNPGELVKGDSVKLKATIYPTTTLSQEVTWTSSDTGVATVSDGKVTGVAVGSTTITVTSKDVPSLTKSIQIEVVKPETYDEFISNRTFSLMGWGYDGGGLVDICWGTAWILNDITPNNSSDYKYRLATNWHVVKGIETVKSKTTNFNWWFGCNTKTEGLTWNSSDDYTKFSDGQITLADDSYSEYDGSTITITDGETTKTGKKGIDFHLVDVDFANITSSSTTNNKITKTKLDKLNKLTAVGKEITPIAPTTTDSSHYENLPLYTGGFPVNSSKNATWECHDLSQGQTVSGKPVTLTYKNASSVLHWCDSTDSPLTDCSPQYCFDEDDICKNWMNGGASGSMLIANFGTTSIPLFKVIGIYWGGMGFEAEGTHDSYLKPYFSIFNSSWKQYHKF